jgi:para-aminobenzoate synthetase component 1
MWPPEMDRLGAAKVPCLFIIDFEMENAIVFPLEEVDAGGILYDVAGRGNAPPPEAPASAVSMPAAPCRTRNTRRRSPGSANINCGATPTLPTSPSPRRSSLTPRSAAVFHSASAKYRLLYRDRFVVFSPETFVRIDGNVISTHPMKGTIDAAVPDAEAVILNDEKEAAEHLTIVDLLRSDLASPRADVASALRSQFPLLYVSYTYTVRIVYV